jgi:Protein of unknown function (DUF2786)
VKRISVRHALVAARHDDDPARDETPDMRPPCRRAADVEPAAQTLMPRGYKRRNPYRRGLPGRCGWCILARRTRTEERPISKPFTENEQRRFRNLLELANSSPYQGERDNAMAAAERLAERHGMTLEDAASGWMQTPRQEPSPRSGPEMAQERELARIVHLMDYQIQLDKARIAEAMKEAIARGYDPEADRIHRRQQPKALQNWRPSRSRRRMEPYRHARVLLEETSLPIEEIADITGLDVYKVAGLKLQIRRSSGAGR